MAELLLNKIINEEISSKLLIQWILKSVPENADNFKDILACNVGQIDFITYFLNFVHEETCNSKLSETAQQCSAPKLIDIEKNHQATEAFANQSFKTYHQNSNFDTSLDKCSTPKCAKTPSGSKKDGYFSPISPLYKNPNFGSEESKQTNQSRHSAYTHCLADFLVTTPTSSSKKKKLHIEQSDSKKEAARRIKPTSICRRQLNNDFHTAENSFNFHENIEEVAVKTPTEQRNLLVEQRFKILSNIESTSPPIVLKRQSSITKADVKPMSSLVTCKNKINHVVDIYKTILNNNFMLNITSEIYFLISLFLTRQTGGSQHNSRVLGDDQEENFNSLDNIIPPKLVDKRIKHTNLEIFQTIHNVVYFAIKCLESQVRVIQFYDKTTITLLAENERIKDFSPALSKKLLKHAEKKTEKPSIETDTPLSQTNVCFDIDTDNQDNFTDCLSFHAFRKQRDLFYEILRIWETRHLASEWDFSLGLGGRIRSLFSFHADSSNYMHVARLFKNQLLGSCARGPKEKGLSESQLPFLPSLPIDAEKLNRLTNRLVTKQASNGINSLPGFFGYQEFFKKFIVIASNYYFNRHLCDILISEIIELNDTKFSGLDFEEEGNEVDENTRKLYVSCVKKLRILAKFLGFVEALPYQSGSPNVPKNVVEVQLKIRERIAPSLNIKSLLESAIDSHTVVLIIPWLTKYLAMLDHVTLRLPYYTSVHRTLFDLYRNYYIPETSNNAAVIKFCLGWLFELPHFPEVEYFDFCNKNESCHDGTIGTKVSLKAKRLDYMSIVNQSVLYLCCPYMEEIKRILSTSAPGSKVAVKYITPITAVESSGEITRKKLEQQLEEAFFSSQPTSLRKTVEFVSERIASIAVKCICYDLVPKAKEAAKRDLKENLLKTADIENYVDFNQRKAALKTQASVIAQNHLTTFLQTCDEETTKISRQKILSSIDCLLPADTLVETKSVCTRTTEKMYTERVKQWINSHVNLSVFTKDFDSEIQKKAVNGKRGDKEKVAVNLPSGGRNCDHNENSLSGFHVLNHIREACCEVIENDDISSEYVLHVLQETYKSLTQRNDVNDSITAVILHTVFDFCLLLVAKYPSLFSNQDLDLTSHFLKIWSHHPKSNSMFRAFFCPRNVKMLKISNKKDEAWDMYARIVSSLLEKKLIDEEDLESQCTGFYNRDWSADILENFSLFLRKLMSYSNGGLVDHKFAYLLDFLSDFCSDL